MLLRNLRKKLKLREKLRRTYYEENDNYDYTEKNNKNKYSRFFLTNIDLKDSLQEKSTIDFNFGLLDDADRSRFFSVNNYMVYNSNFHKYNLIYNTTNSKPSEKYQEYKDKLICNIDNNSFENEEQNKKNKFKKHFYDTNARYIISTAAWNKNNKVQKNLIKFFNSKRLENINDISEMKIDFSKSKFLETSLNSNISSNSYFNNKYNSEKKQDSLIVEEEKHNENKCKKIIKEFMNSGGIYEIACDTNNQNHILKISDKKVNETNNKDSNSKKRIDNINETEVNYVRGIYSDINNLNLNDPNNKLTNKIFNNNVTNESLYLKEDDDLYSNFVVTNYEEKTETSKINDNYNEEKYTKNDPNSKVSFPIKSSRKVSEDKETIKDTNLKKTLENNKIINIDDFKIVNMNKEDLNKLKNLNNSNKKLMKQRSLERNQSTKNLFLDTNHFRKPSEYENNDIYIFIENNNSNKVANKDTENNYYNIQTRKSIKKSKINFISHKTKTINNSNNNKLKKNVNLNRNISGSPNNRLNNEENKESIKDNYRQYYESKLYKEKKERNSKLLNNQKNKYTDKNKKINKEGKKIFNNNSKSPFKLASDYDSELKRKNQTLNRVQSVQDLHNNMQIDKTIFDSKEKKNLLLYSKSLVKNNTSSKIEKIKNTNKINYSNRLLDKNTKNNNLNNNKKSPFENECNVYLKENVTKTYKTIVNNNNSSYRGKLFSIINN